jgi:hypothetical protein
MDLDEALKIIEKENSSLSQWSQKYLFFQ